MITEYSQSAHLLRGDRSTAPLDVTDRVTPDEARGCLLRLVNSHFGKGEQARISRPANPARDDDLRLAAFIEAASTITYPAGDRADPLDQIDLAGDLAPMPKADRPQASDPHQRSFQDLLRHVESVPLTLPLDMRQEDVERLAAWHALPAKQRSRVPGLVPADRRFPIDSRRDELLRAASLLMLAVQVMDTVQATDAASPPVG